MSEGEMLDMIKASYSPLRPIAVMSPMTRRRLASVKGETLPTDRGKIHLKVHRFCPNDMLYMVDVETWERWRHEAGVL